MGFPVKDITPEFTDKYISVRTASQFSGYNRQYLRRLLREGVFRTKKLDKSG